MPSKVLTITDPFIIKMAWGPRRVTSSKRYGDLKPEDAYPKSVTASRQMWLDWINDNAPRWIDGDEPYVVIPETKAEKRIQDQIADIGVEEPPTISDSELKELSERREALRREKKFKEADEIRDYIEAHGKKVLDPKIESL